MTHINQLKMRFAAIGSGLLLTGALCLPANADEIWKINYAKSHFGPASNTLVLEYKGNSQHATTTAIPSGSSLLVIAGKKVYLVTDETTASGISSGNSVRTIDYTRWRDMKMVQVGDNARTNYYCQLRCQSGFRESSVTLTFMADGVDLSKQGNNMLALDAH